MAVPTVVGLMSLPWIVALAALILAEQNWRYGRGLAKVVGLGMVTPGS
jgi:predicted metal-binding membrane protein